jgi:uncharacterized protein
MKYLVLLLVLVVALGAMWLGRRKGEPAAGKRRPDASPAALQQMVACAHCGLNLPQGEALVDDAGRPYCSAEHRRLGPRA